MHYIQQQTIKRYQEKFPKDTLREISEKTQIQLTRVFRIINGYEMKLSEYIQFQNLINTIPTPDKRSCELQYINNHFFSIDDQSASDLKNRVEYLINLSLLRNI